MSFKKRENSNWTDIPNYIHNTFTDTITTLPADIYPTGTTATVGLKGNMSQSGTPTPTTPIQPQETGERTGNLFDKYSNYSVGTNTNNYTITGLKPNTQYTCSTNFEKTSGIYTASIYFGGGSSATNGVWANSPNTQTSTSEGTILLSLRFRSEAGAPAVYDDIMNGIIWVMINEGSTPLPYEPYGYKIPISSANATTPIYLGEVETTRKVKKLVLTGEEQFHPHQIIASWFHVFLNDIVINNLELCTHYKPSSSSSAADIQNGEILVQKQVTGNKGRIIIRDTAYTTADDFKAYLAAQYAAGTPVIVWYVLATPETAVVNEPLRKIGDYADTVSGITIPTITGANTIDVETTLKPSEVSINYKGWHPITDVHEAENGQWD